MKSFLKFNVRIEMLAFFWLGFLSPISEASSQPEYDAILARIYSFSYGQWNVYSSCVKRFPAKEVEYSEKYKNWEERNSLLLNEIYAHFEGMIRRKAQTSGRTEDASKKEIYDLIGTIHAPMIKAIEANDENHAKKICDVLIMDLDKQTLEEKYARQLSVIRACKDNGLCPFLN